MHLKHILARDAEEAAMLASAALGPEFILGDPDPGGDGFGVLALADEDAPAGGFAPPDFHGDPETLIGEVLALHRVPPALAERILAAVAATPARVVGDPVGDLGAGLAACLSFGAFGQLWTGGSIALVGPPGAGKTTLAAKLAARGGRYRRLLVDADAARAGAGRQLAEHATTLGATLATLQELEAKARRLRGRTRRLVLDTSGVNPFDAAALARLSEQLGAARAEPILVLPANIAPAEAAAMAAAFEGFPIRRMLATRLDMVRRLGGLIAASEAGGYELVGGSVTPQVAYGLCPLTATILARRLIASALDARRWRTG